MEYSTSTCDVVGSSTVCVIETTLSTSTVPSTTTVELPQYVETTGAVFVFTAFVLVFFAVMFVINWVIGNLTTK